MDVSDASTLREGNMVSSRRGKSLCGGFRADALGYSSHK